MTVQRRPAPEVKKAPQPARKQRLRLWIRLLRASRAIEGQLRERLRVEYGMTLPRFDVMAALARKPEGMTMTELSRFLMVSNGNVTGIIDRLVAEGLVVRMADKTDRRATFVRLTREGAQQFEIIAKVHEVWVDELLAGLSSEDAESMMELLCTLAAGWQGKGRQQ
jgi:DNA-binding MarR family transcriptional regulator